MTTTELKNAVRRKLGNITSNDYSDADIVNSMNSYYQKAIAIAIQISGEWEINGEIATTDIVAGQKEYALTTDVPLSYLKRIEVNLSGGVNDWEIADIIDLRTYHLPLSNENLGSNDRPIIDIFDNSIIFKDAPSVNVTDGLKIYYNKSAVELDSGKIQSIEIANGGSGYVVNDILTIHSGNDDCTFKVLTVDESGTITDVILVNGGTGYAIGSTIATTGGTGTLATMNIISIDGTIPNLIPVAFDYLIDGACLDYSISYDLTSKINVFSSKVVEDQKNIERHYSNRLTAVKPSIGMSAEYLNSNME